MYMCTYAYTCTFLHVYAHVKRIEFVLFFENWIWIDLPNQATKTKEKRKRGYSSLLLELQTNKLI